jgi:hypothetical protein
MLSEKPAPAPAPAKRDGWEGFGRDVSSVEKEEVHSEPASWGVLNQIGVEVSAHGCLLLFIADLMKWIGLGWVGLR